MSLSHGRPMVSIPGPSVIPDRVLAAMHRAMPNIYEGDLVEVSYSVQDDLRKIARTEQPVYISVSNGHGAWEMAISNTLSRGAPKRSKNASKLTCRERSQPLWSFKSTQQRRFAMIFKRSAQR